MVLGSVHGLVCQAAAAQGAGGATLRPAEAARFDAAEEGQGLPACNGLACGEVSVPAQSLTAVAEVAADLSLVVQGVGDFHH